jgi:hypothetical protein
LVLRAGDPTADPVVGWFANNVEYKDYDHYFNYYYYNYYPSRFRPAREGVYTPNAQSNRDSF